MATWIAHLRVAEHLLSEMNGIEKTAFVAGNIAPDSGVPNEDWSSFDPPGHVTHWLNDDKKIDATAFYNQYLAENTTRADKEQFSFLLGYYVHLLTDIEWSQLFEKKKQEPLYKDNLEKDPKFIWTIKKDWYGQDFEYLIENKDALFYTCFQHMTEVKDYLDYFPKGAFTNRFEYIRTFYQKPYTPNAQYLYLSKTEMDDFVKEASRSIKESCRNIEFSQAK